jgi:hypothetical protein
MYLRINEKKYILNWYEKIFISAWISINTAWVMLATTVEKKKKIIFKKNFIQK